jgi:hypothetical protein
MSRCLDIKHHFSIRLISVDHFNMSNNSIIHEFITNDKMDVTKNSLESVIDLGI